MVNHKLTITQTSTPSWIRHADGRRQKPGSRPPTRAAGRDQDAGDSDLMCGNAAAGWVSLDLRRAQPMARPEEDNNKTEDGAGVLEKFIDMDIAHDGDCENVMQQRKVFRLGPSTVVGKRVPHVVGERANEDRDENEQQLERSTERHGVDTGNDPVADVPGHESRQRLLDKVVKYPKGSKGDGQAEKEQTAKGMSEGPFGGETQEEFEVWREGAEDQRRQNEAGPPEGIRGRCVRQGKGHTVIIADPFPPLTTGSAARWAVSLAGQRGFPTTCVL